ncbi:hypothetical protein [Devosia sp.]|uniref:hypothetical protein n=1 Tax=Devosia sp. TaxID=1871048 RepID=UPI003A91C482
MSRQSEASKRASPISIRFNEAELGMLRRKAGTTPLSTYIKRSLFKSQGWTANPELLAQVLARLGEAEVMSKLEVLARAAESNSLDNDPDTIRRISEACEAVIAMRLLLLSALSEQSP